MKKITAVLLLLTLFLVSCGETSTDLSTDSLDISSASSEESAMSEDSDVSEESNIIDDSSFADVSTDDEKNSCKIHYDWHTQNEKIFEIKGEKAVILYDFINERMKDAPEPTEEQFKGHLGIKVEDDTVPINQPLSIMFILETGYPYYDVYPDGFVVWSPSSYMSSQRYNMLPEDTFDKIVELAEIELS